MANSLSDERLISKTVSLLNQESLLREDCTPHREVKKVWDTFASKEFIQSNPSFKPEGFLPRKDSIFISPFSCEHQAEGKGIIAHELGHAISHVMARSGMSKNSSRSYLKLRKCVTSKWKKHPSAQLLFHKGDKIYTEEDTADVISYMAINESTSLYSCALLYPKNEEYTLLNITTAIGDNHSSGMIRLLRELNYKAPQKIPETCGELIKRNPDKLGNNCI